MDEKAKHIVEQGYDRIGADYERWSEKATDHARERYTKLLLDVLPERAVVLDLGCGSGELLTRQLSRHFEVHRSRNSPHHMVELARQNAPVATFVSC